MLSQRHVRFVFVFVICDERRNSNEIVNGIETNKPRLN